MLLFDFGSGESKWMLYSLTKHKMVEILEGDNSREVRLACIAPSCIAYLVPVQCIFGSFPTERPAQSHFTLNLGASIIGTRVCSQMAICSNSIARSTHTGVPRCHRSQYGGNCQREPLATPEETNGPGRESHWRCTVHLPEAEYVSYEWVCVRGEVLYFDVWLNK